MTAGLVCAGFLTHPSPAYAGIGEVQQTVTHVVTFDSQGTVTQHVTSAPTVGEFLTERGIVVGERDYLAPAADVPLSDKLTITYRPAVHVTIVGSHLRRETVSNAEDVGALLEEQNIRVGHSDVVTPALADSIPANGTVHITRIVMWNRTEKRKIAERIEHRLDFSMTPGTTKIVSSGTPGERDVMVRFTQRDDGKVEKAVLSSYVVKPPRPRIIAEGIGEFEAFKRFAEHGVQQTAYVAAAALDMVATAYTAYCTGCSGITAIGRPAGHGIVAVDPSVIPLGARLYIPGYGFAIAGDTGGAIRGHRIDLGFNSMRDAMLFGRREVVVYRLK